MEILKITFDFLKTQSEDDFEPYRGTRRRLKFREILSLVHLNDESELYIKPK